jgi:hypothetical protein
MTVYAVMFAPVPNQDFVFYNVICRGLLYVQWVRGYCSFGGIVDYHYLNKNVDITSRKHVFFTTGLSFREKFYGLLAAGLALVLFLSLLCNFYFCINRKCNKESGLILKESP